MLSLFSRAAMEIMFCFASYYTIFSLLSRVLQILAYTTRDKSSITKDCIGEHSGVKPVQRYKDSWKKTLGWLYVYMSFGIGIWRRLFKMCLFLWTHALTSKAASSVWWLPLCCRVLESPRTGWGSFLEGWLKMRHIRATCYICVKFGFMHFCLDSLQRSCKDFTLSPVFLYPFEFENPRFKIMNK